MEKTPPLTSLLVSGVLLLVAILAEATIYPQIHTLDQEILKHVNIRQGNLLVEAVAATGSIEFTGLIAIAVLAWEYYRLRKVGPDTIGLWTGLALSMTLVFLLKQGLATPRPPTSGYMSRAGGLLGRVDQYAFPSGHTTRASTIASYYTGRRGTLTTIALWAWALAVAVSRIIQGVHWSSDVIAGLIVGWFSGVFGKIIGSRLAEEYSVFKRQG
ncbi:MAG: phosphatase PAP2 family protein [Desulfurococcales archaeon]|nr:phosphatase PAP2 family protein [Desulfurococcales archaeon]